MTPEPPLNGAIDVHAHFITPRLRAAMGKAGHDGPDGMAAIPAWSPEEALSTMDETGISTALLSVSSPACTTETTGPPGTWPGR